MKLRKFYFTELKKNWVHCFWFYSLCLVIFLSVLNVHKNFSCLGELCEFKKKKIHMLEKILVLSAFCLKDNAFVPFCDILTWRQFWEICFMIGINQLYMHGMFWSGYRGCLSCKIKRRLMLSGGKPALDIRINGIKGVFWSFGWMWRWASAVV